MLNENIFDVIDTKEKAYWLGFLMADGSNNNNDHIIRFSQKTDNKYIIEKLCDFLNYPKEKIEYKEQVFNSKKYTKYNGRISKISTIKFQSKHMSDVLKYYGVCSPKIENVKLFECNNEELELSFLSGFYDGDGNVKSCYLNCKNINFLLSIKNKYNLKTKIYEHINEIGSCYCLHLSIPLRRKIILTYPSLIPEKMILDKEDKGIITNLMLNGVSYEDAKKKSLENFHISAQNQPKKFEVTKEHLYNLIHVEKLPYTKIGQMYGVTVNAIKKRAKRLGIILDVRRSTPTMNPSEINP